MKSISEKLQQAGDVFAQSQDLLGLLRACCEIQIDILAALQAQKEQKDESVRPAGGIVFLQPPAGQAPTPEHHPTHGAAPKTHSQPPAGQAPTPEHHPTHGAAPKTYSQPPAGQAPAPEHHPTHGAAPKTYSQPPAGQAPAPEHHPTHGAAPKTHSPAQENSTAQTPDAHPYFSLYTQRSVPSGKPSSYLASPAANPPLDLNDTLRSAVPQALSELIDNTPIDDIANHIPLNDRFLFINELFRGNDHIFAQTLHQLNQCENLTQAQRYLHEHVIQVYGWDMQSVFTNKFLQLVKRKFARIT